jgi:hypothetical protein
MVTDEYSQPGVDDVRRPAQDRNVTFLSKEDPMGKWSWDRLAAGSGIVAIVLFVIAVLLPGAMPQASDSKAKIVHYFAAHHRSGLASAIFGGLGLIAMLWFFGCLARTMRRSGEERLADVTIGGIAIALATLLIAGGMQTALFFGIDTPGVVKALFVMSTIVSAFGCFPLAASLGAFAVAEWRSGMLPQWHAMLTGLAAVLVLFNGGSLAHKGFYSPTGAYGFIALIGAFVWVAITSGLLMRQPAGERAPRAAAVAA